MMNKNCWLQTTQSTMGGAVTAVTHPQQWGPDLQFFGQTRHADPLMAALLLIKSCDVETNPGPIMKMVIIENVIKHRIVVIWLKIMQAMVYIVYRDAVRMINEVPSTLC